MRTIAAILLLWALAPAPARAASAAQGAQAQMARSTSTLPSVEASTSAERQVTVSDLYNGAKYRDPFAAVTGESPAAAQIETLRASAAKGEEVEDGGEEDEPAFSIHSLNLKGVMKDPRGAAAILVHVKTGEGFVLRNGRLYDYKNKRVEGVAGSIQLKQKPAVSSVTLMTPDKDVQILILGEDEGGEAVKKSP
ncbi:MAG: hypothetical protein HY922_17800 [Elusimicrobia bacterium]|nr:hypothetical protein [Elusimicrobiota bacterium]